MTESTFHCDECNKDITQSHHDLTAGYATNDKGGKVCYSCCAEGDKRWMMDKGKITLYFHAGKVTNWPSSLVFPVTRQSVGRHNIAGKRYDFWFIGPDRHVWHGYQLGDNTQIAHCKRTRQTV